MFGDRLIPVLGDGDSRRASDAIDLVDAIDHRGATAPERVILDQHGIHAHRDACVPDRAGQPVGAARHDHDRAHDRGTSAQARGEGGLSLLSAGEEAG